VSVAESLERLRAAADDGRLDEMARRHDVGLITVFGSATRAPEQARDLDVAVSLPAERTSCSGFWKISRT
jgi:predicted nucleotidyltransferase